MYSRDFVGGPNGSGKTSLAHKMANIFGYEVVSLESYYKPEHVKDFKHDDFNALDLSLLSTIVCSGRPFVRQEEKWWLPCPEVPENGLSVGERKRLQQCRDRTGRILKAVVAFNSSVLAEMETPVSYIETLPKKAKECLGDIIYRYIKAEQYSPGCLLDFLDVSSEHQALEIANRIEAAVHFIGKGFL